MGSNVLWGELSALSGALQWAFCGVLLTRLTRKVHVLTIGAARAITALVFFLVLVPFTGGWQMFAGLPPRILVTLFVSVLIAQGIGDATFFMAASRIGMVRTMPLAMTNPLVTAGLAALFLGERITPQMGLGAVLILAGAYLLSSGPRAATEGAPAKADALGFVFAGMTVVCWSIGSVLLTPISRLASPVAINAIRQLIIAGWFLLIMPKPLGFRQVRELSRREQITLLIVSAVSSGLGSFFYVWGVRYAGASLNAVLSASSPAFSTPLSIYLLGEKVTRRIVIGTVLIVAGVWLVLLA